VTGPGPVEFHVWRTEPDLLEAERLKRLYPRHDVGGLFAMDLAALHELAAAMNEVYGEDIGPIDTSKGRMTRVDLIRTMLEYRARFAAKALASHARAGSSRRWSEDGNGRR